MGFCVDPPMLVYEFMERGSLYMLLFKVCSLCTSIELTITITPFIARKSTTNLESTLESNERCLQRTAMAALCKHATWRHKIVKK